MAKLCMHPNKMISFWFRRHDSERLQTPTKTKSSKLKNIKPMIRQMNKIDFEYNSSSLLIDSLYMVSQFLWSQLLDEMPSCMEHPEQILVAVQSISPCFLFVYIFLWKKQERLVLKFYMDRDNSLSPNNLSLECMRIQNTGGATTCYTKINYKRIYIKNLYTHTYIYVCHVVGLYVLPYVYTYCACLILLLNGMYIPHID